MKTKVIILLALLTLIIFAGATKQQKPECPKQQTIDLSEEFQRLDKLANKTEKSIKYQTPCTDFNE